jgi:Kelch motif/Galactose oxidase, central domain
MIKPPIEDRVRDYVAAERSAIQPPSWLTARILSAVEAARPAPARDRFRMVRVGALVAGLLVVAAGIASIRMIGFGPSPAGVPKGTWSSVPGMAEPRGNHTATLLPNGKVLVVGGGDQYVGALGSAELYDPVARKWSSAGKLMTPRLSHTATLLRTGKVLVVGGQTNAVNSHQLPVGQGLSTAELYDPLTNRWSPAAPMSTIRALHTATLLADGRVLVVGGYTASPGGTGVLVDGKVLASAELYDPASNRWTPVRPLGAARAAHGASLLQDNRVLVMGGVDVAPMQSSVQPPLQSSEIYDPATEAWSPAPNMLFRRVYPKSTVLPNGQVLVTGDDRTGAAPAELFDPVASRWVRVPNMGPYRPGLVAASLPNGNVLVAGGQGDTPAHLYDWRSNAWHDTGSLKFTPDGPTGTTLKNGQVLIAGGFGPTGAYADVELYDPSGRPATTVIPRGTAGALSIGLGPLLAIVLVVLTVALWSLRRRARRDDGWLADR